MPFVHVPSRNTCVAQLPKDTIPANSEYDLLTKPVRIVSAVEAFRQSPVLRPVLRQIGVQQDNRHIMTRQSVDLVAPGGNSYLAAFNRNAGQRPKILQFLRGVPLFRAFDLNPAGVQTLVKVPFPVKQRHADDRKPQIRGGSQRVSRKDAQSAAIGRNALFQSYLH